MCAPPEVHRSSGPNLGGCPAAGVQKLGRGGRLVSPVVVHLLACSHKGVPKNCRVLFVGSFMRDLSIYVHIRCPCFVDSPTRRWVFCVCVCVSLSLSLSLSLRVCVCVCVSCFLQDERRGRGGSAILYTLEKIGNYVCTSICIHIINMSKYLYVYVYR